MILSSRKGVRQCQVVPVYSCSSCVKGYSHCNIYFQRCVKQMSEFDFESNNNPQWNCAGICFDKQKDKTSVGDVFVLRRGIWKR